jgi:hypothetical protein
MSAHYPMSPVNPDRRGDMYRFRWTLAGVGLVVSLFVARFGVRVYQIRAIDSASGCFETPITTKPIAPKYLRDILGDQLVSYFEPVEFVSLDCRASRRTAAEAEHLIWCLTGLSEVKHLDLWGEWISDSSLQSLQSLPQLERLAMHETSATEFGLASLARLPNLRTLVLEESSISDQTLAAIAGIRDLEILAVDSPRITDAGMRHLASMPRLRDLRLDRTSITDSGLLDLQSVHCLRELSVSQTRVTDGGIETLHRFRPELNITDD